MIDDHQNPSRQKEPYQEFEEWQKSFMDDVYSLFNQGDEPRGNIAFDNWEKRFTKFLEKKLPSKKEDYVRQTRTRTSVKTFGMSPVSYFNQRKGDAVRAFITQLIEDAKKGYLDDEYIKDSPEEAAGSRIKSDTLKIFISHSSRDLQLVALIVDLLRSALNLLAQDIRCTSLDGYRLPGGADIDAQLRNEIIQATTLIGVISNESFDSAYVLFELGARWGQGTNLIPLLAHGMTANNLKGPITGYNALRSDSAAQLYQFIDDVGKQLHITPEPPQALQAKIKAIIEYKKGPDRKKRSSLEGKKTNEDIFTLLARAPLEKAPDEFRWASIDVVNISPFTIKNCFITLDDILDQSGQSILTIKRKRRLLWSYGEGQNKRDKELEVTPQEPRVGDVATTFPDNKQMRFETQTGQEIKERGIYEVVITVHGQLNGIPKTKTSSFILEYRGGNVLTIINKGAAKWPDSNPTGLDIASKQLPPFSRDPSS